MTKINFSLAKSDGDVDIEKGRYEPKSEEHGEAYERIFKIIENANGQWSWSMVNKMTYDVIKLWKTETSEENPILWFEHNGDDSAIRNEIQKKVENIIGARFDHRDHSRIESACWEIKDFEEPRFDKLLVAIKDSRVTYDNGTEERLKYVDNPFWKFAMTYVILHYSWLKWNPWEYQHIWDKKLAHIYGYVGEIDSRLFAACYMGIAFAIGLCIIGVCEFIGVVDCTRKKYVKKSQRRVNLLFFVYFRRITKRT